MHLKNLPKIAILFLISLLLSHFSFAQITAMASFDIDNEMPAITSVELKGNDLEMEISDLNGYQDILDDGHVKIILADSVKEAVFEKGEGRMIYYNYTFEEIPEDSEKIKIEISDGVNYAGIEHEIKDLKPKEGFLSITGSTVSEINSDLKIGNLFTNLFELIKRIFGK